MKILYHHRTRCTDAQRVHILEMVNAFRTLGHEVRIASVVDSEGEAPDETAEPAWKKLVHRVPFFYEFLQLGYNLVAIPWLLAKLIRWQPDFIYERYSLLNISGVIAARLCRIPIVLEVNSPFALEQHQENEIRAVRLALRTETFICNLATRVVVVSGPLRRILIGQGIRESKLMVMPNGVNLDHLRSATGAELRSRLDLTGRTVVGFVGWFRKWHGLELLVDAFAAAGLAGSGASLVFIGDGPAMPDLRLRASTLPPGSVVFTGGIAHEQIATYFDLIDIAVQPAANPYCCPMKIIEYMGLGKAIVAPRQENIQELLADGKEALLFTPDDGPALGAALASLLDDRALRTRLGHAAFDAIQRRGMLWTDNAAAIVSQMTRVSDQRQAGSSVPNCVRVQDDTSD